MGDLMYRVTKRVVDVVLASAMLVLGSPVLALLALAIKVDSRGPVLFSQRRWGKDATEFHLYKFRTMKHMEASGEIRAASVGDERVTRVGKILRATGLDELPQLVNILKGEMSFVGPRALAIGEIVETEEGVTEYEDLPQFRERLSMPPGLTGPATIYLSKDTSPASKFEMDLRYVRERRFLLDMRLILISFWISLNGRWESRDSKLR